MSLSLRLPVACAAVAGLLAGASVSGLQELSRGPRSAVRGPTQVEFEALRTPGRGQRTAKPAEVRTLTYATRNGVDLLLDLYLPAVPIRRPVPVIVFLHGGGWSGGTRTTGPDLKRYFAQDGFAMASIEYRLTPTVTFPANVEDVRTAVRWLKANAAAHGLDPERLCLWGTSAGAHLAAVAALAPRGTFEGNDNLNQTSAVRCVLEAYGPTRFDRMDAQAAEGRPTLQTPVVTINVGGGARGSGPPGGGRAPCRMTIRHRRSHGCSVLPCRLSPTACGKPAL